MEQTQAAPVSQKIPLAAIRPDSTQSRAFFDPEALEQLKNSLRGRGRLPGLDRDRVPGLRSRHPCP